MNFFSLSTHDSKKWHIYTERDGIVSNGIPSLFLIEFRIGKSDEIVYWTNRLNASAHLYASIFLQKKLLPSSGFPAGANEQQNSRKGEKSEKEHKGNVSPFSLWN